MAGPKIEFKMLGGAAILCAVAIAWALTGATLGAVAGAAVGAVYGSPFGLAAWHGGAAAGFVAGLWRALHGAPRRAAALK